MPTTKVRLRFAKQGDLRLVSHHDLMRCLERLLRRAALPVAHSQGFNPRPKVAFPLALGLGIEAHREVVEIELAEPLEPDDVLARLAAQAPPGLHFVAAEPAGPGRSPRVAALHYALAIPAAHRDATRTALEAFLASDRWPYLRRRPERTVEADLRPFVTAAALDEGGTLRLRMRLAPEGSARPEEVIDALGLRPLLDHGAVLVRTDVELEAPARPEPPSAAAPEPTTA
jgi:radical SAM-linked protein